METPHLEIQISPIFYGFVPSYVYYAAMQPSWVRSTCSGVGWGQGGQLSSGAGLRGRKIGDPKKYFKSFFVIIHSDCHQSDSDTDIQSVSRIGIQLTRISFSVFLSCIAYIHSGYLYSALSRNLLRRNLRHFNWYRRLGSLAVPCDSGTITEISVP